MISCSISGVIANRDQCPAIPYTPEEYAAEARRAVEEGASQIHIHARKPDGTPSYEIEDFKAITEAILAEVGDVIINYSTGAIGIPIEKRIEYLRALRPDVAALNMSSMNYAKYSQAAQGLRLQGRLREQLRHDHRVPDRDAGAGDQARARVLRRRPRRQPRSADRHGAAGAAAADLTRHGGQRRHPADRPQRRLRCPSRSPAGAEGQNQWQVIGISRDQWKLLGSALVLGGNVRAGVEDNLYLPNGEMATLQRRADRQGPPDGRGRRPPRSHRRRGARALGSAQA